MRSGREEAARYLAAFCARSKDTRAGGLWRGPQLSCPRVFGSRANGSQAASGLLLPAPHSCPRVFASRAHASRFVVRACRAGAPVPVAT
eukprot:9721674-Heterocapsa_arctica.AAC.1